MQVVVQRLATSIYSSLFLFCLFSCISIENDIEYDGYPKGSYSTSHHRRYIKHRVPISGNSFITFRSEDSHTNEVITDLGLGNWTSSSTIISTYFRVSKPGRLSIGLRAKVPQGRSVVKVSIGNTHKNLSLTGNKIADHTAGTFHISSPGYVKIDIQGVEKTGGYFADVTDIVFSGPVASGENIFANRSDFYYWARRGPSCHLGYILPTVEDISYFYNEVTIPEGKDKIGSYFMTNGFSEGYFGMQVISNTERRIIFSVWSDFKTDNPSEIPMEYKVLLNKKGNNVYSSDFGGEGSGGKAFLKYNWEANKTYKFLVESKPDGHNSTYYTAWFLPPDESSWKLIASWKKPKVNTYLNNLHVFVENFNPEYGYLGRKAEYKNGWIRTKTGNWLPLSEARFTVDTSYQNKQRIDAIGGVIGNSFFLQNGGFFNTIVEPQTTFIIPTHEVKPPNIDFSSLP